MHFLLVGGERAIEQAAQLVRVATLAHLAQAVQHLTQAQALRRDERIFVAPPAVGADEELQFAPFHEFGLIANGERAAAIVAGDGLRCVAHGPIVARMSGGFHA